MDSQHFRVDGFNHSPEVLRKKFCCCQSYTVPLHVQTAVTSCANTRIRSKFSIPVNVQCFHAIILQEFALFVTLMCWKHNIFCCIWLQASQTSSRNFNLRSNLTALVLRLEFVAECNKHGNKAETVLLNFDWHEPQENSVWPVPFTVTCSWIPHSEVHRKLQL